MPGFTTVSIRAHHRSPPVLRLNADVLLHILFLNADMDHETKKETILPAIVTLRRSSQVCRDWRHLAIGSPSLWAQVLYLNSLLLKGDSWMKEVLHRTGTSRLHIKSTPLYNGKTLTAGNAVLCLLTENWTRIRSLDLDLSLGFNPNRHQWTHLFQLPAPVLEVFRYSPPFGLDCLVDQSFFLFSGKSPLLHTLSVLGMTIHFSTISAPKLRNLNLGSGCLFIHDEGIPLSLLSVVNLSQLTTIKFDIRHSINIALAFLAHIIPADGCTLDFSGRYDRETPDQHTEMFYRKILSRYSRSCTGLSTATNLVAVFFLDSISFLVNLPCNRQFSFLLGTNSYKFPDETISSLLSSFATIPFAAMPLSNITKLGLYLSNDDEISMNPDVIKLILTLISVEELATDYDTTTVLMQETQHNPALIPFPALKVWDLHHIHNTDELLEVADLINAWVKRGFPADKLVVRVEGSDDVLRDLISFRNLVPGLTVSSNVTKPDINLHYIS